MSPCIREVRNHLKRLLTTLSLHLPGEDIRLGVLLQGDYCDERTTYVTMFSGFTTDPLFLGRWIDSQPNTNGGDSDECYEYVLYQMTNQIPWRTGAKKIAVMVGDAHPHRRNYTLRHSDYSHFPNLYWTTERAKVEEMGIVLYTIQCMTRHNGFWDQLPCNQGIRLWLAQFNDALVYIEAIALRDKPDEMAKYTERLESEFRMNRVVAEALDAIKTGTSMTVGSWEPTHRHAVRTRITRDYGEPGFNAVPPERFQVLKVHERVAIKYFVEHMGCRFQKGHGFYEFTKRETIQEYKEVVLRDIRTGDMFSGKDAREMIGFPYGRRGKLSPREVPPDIRKRYRVFVQSTSVNRVLIPGTWFLYENEII
jgi:hypothetical protein